MTRFSTAGRSSTTIAIRATRYIGGTSRSVCGVAACPIGSATTVYTDVSTYLSTARTVHGTRFSHAISPAPIIDTGNPLYRHVRKTSPSIAAGTYTYRRIRSRTAFYPA